ncbi:unnamed protein product [Arabis nemorensis]|uniref:Uncharacterized protein n=1 Tax=Arabis nemorensis TaxID=586526 RepID=A0A565AXD2_9BRAS|nr:unnamed protein product [Arabis nemorensis]
MAMMQMRSECMRSIVCYHGLEYAPVEAERGVVDVASPAIMSRHVLRKIRVSKRFPLLGTVFPLD